MGTFSLMCCVVCAGTEPLQYFTFFFQMSSNPYVSKLCKYSDWSFLYVLKVLAQYPRLVKYVFVHVSSFATPALLVASLSALTIALVSAILIKCSFTLFPILSFVESPCASNTLVLFSSPTIT